MKAIMVSVAGSLREEKEKTKQVKSRSVEVYKGTQHMGNVELSHSGDLIVRGEDWEMVFNPSALWVQADSQRGNRK